MHGETRSYNDAHAAGDQAICGLLAEQIGLGLPLAEDKVWHGHPVWFLDGNPIVGYPNFKNCVRLLFEHGGECADGFLRADPCTHPGHHNFLGAGEVGQGISFGLTCSVVQKTDVTRTVQMRSG